MRPQHVTKWWTEPENCQKDFHDNERTCQPTVPKTIMNAARVGEKFGSTCHIKIRNYSTAGLSFERYITLLIGMHRQRHREMECLNSYQVGAEAANYLGII